MTSLFGLLSFNHSALWCTFCCVNPDVVTGALPSVTPDIIRWTLFLGPIGYFMGSIVLLHQSQKQMQLLQAFNIRLAHLIVAFSSTILCGLPSSYLKDSYWVFPILFLSLGFNALLSAPVMSLPPLLVSEWFSEDTRGPPLSLSMGANVLGTALWILVGPFLASTPAHFPRILYFRAGSSWIGALACILYCPNYGKRKAQLFGARNALSVEGKRNQFDHENSSPEIDQKNKIVYSRLQVVAERTEHEPSTTRARELAFLRRLFPVKRPLNFYLLVPTVGLHCGLCSALANFLQVVLHEKFSSTDLGWIGIAYCFAHLLGNIVFGLSSRIGILRENVFKCLFAVLSINFVALLATASISHISETRLDSLLGIKLTFASLVSVVGLGTGFLITGISFYGLQLAPELKPEILGTWLSMSVNIGYAAFFGFPVHLLFVYGLWIELAFACLTCVCFIVANVIG